MMSESKTPVIGSIAWHDLTVENADEIRKFYEQVIGWNSSSLSMGDYDDFCMNEPAGGETVAGICHTRGENAKLPPQWLVYITVENVKKSAKQCADLGGKIIDGPRDLSGKPFCVIQDPGGAYVALYQA